MLCVTHLSFFSLSKKNCFFDGMDSFKTHAFFFCAGWFSFLDTIDDHWALLIMSQTKQPKVVASIYTTRWKPLDKPFLPFPHVYKAKLTCSSDDTMMQLKIQGESVCP